MKYLVFLLLGVLSLAAQAQQPGTFVLNPYFPEYNSPYDLTIMDQNLYNELVRFTERRDRMQELLITQLPVDASLVPSNTFVSRRLMDRTSRRFIKSEYFRSSLLGRTGEKIQEATEADITVTDGRNQQHKFDFKLAVFQGQIYFQYSGFTKAQLRYDTSNDGSIAMIFQHDLSKYSSIGIESGVMGADRYQLLTLNVVW